MKVVFYSEEKAIKPTTSKLVAKYALLQAPSKLQNRLAGSRGDSRTGLTRSNLITFDHKHLDLSLLLDLRSKEDFIGPSMLWKLYSGSVMVKFNCYVV